MRAALALIPLLLTLPARADAAQDLAKIFGEHRGAFVMYDLKNDRYTRYDAQRCAQRFSPKSTFKIPNTLIGLESGVIRDANFVIPWDRVRNPPQPNWNVEPFVHWPHDQTLRTAFKWSVVWYYQELARRVGRERMQQFLRRFHYGNETIGQDVDQFWLDGSLQISANEQIDFLRRFYARKLPLRRRTFTIACDVMLVESTPEYRLTAKTGGGSIREGVVIGWYVGFVERGGNVYFFATNVEGPSYMSVRDLRIDVTKQALRALNVLP
ncbi:MAG: penicillin-binding transpeptidase domain-containing protein [Acidobacteriota bacterium]|nr:penicillin-binding transpeptidase domain-containing protein [Acidobacteriota bacterium]